MKVSPRACRHCKSPARHNPCWWYLDGKSEASGYDAPCFEEDGYEYRRAAAGRRRWLWAWLLLTPGTTVLVWAFGYAIWRAFLS